MGNFTQQQNVNIANNAFNAAKLAIKIADQATLSGAQAVTQAHQVVFVLNTMYPDRSGTLPTKNLKERFRRWVLRFLGIDPDLLPACNYMTAKLAAEEDIDRILKTVELKKTEPVSNIITPH